MIRRLTEAECLAAMETGEFDTVLVSGPATAIILTQTWCPQWTTMKAYLPKVETAIKNVRIYYVEYDIENWETLTHDDFMTFKEKKFKNLEIPYVRYYKNGVYSRDSNYISLDGFKSRL